MGEEDVAVVLEEQGVSVADVEGYPVGELHLLEGGLFGHDLFDEGVEEGVGLQERGPEGALDGGFEFLFWGGGEALQQRVSFHIAGGRRGPYSFLKGILFVEVERAARLSCGELCGGWFGSSEGKWYGADFENLVFL